MFLRGQVQANGGSAASGVHSGSASASSSGDDSLALWGVLPSSGRSSEPETRENSLPCSTNTVTLMCADCAHEHVVEIGCNRRTCPDCMEKRYYRLRNEYDVLNDHLSNPKILTLTMKHDYDVERLYDRLTTAFSKLRRREVFQSVTGGFYAVEVKPKPNGLWNVHLHAIIDGGYVPKGRLSEEWKDLTGDSYIVDIQSLRNRKAGVSYVLGYCASASKVAEVWDGQPESRRIEYEEAVKHRRMIQTFGSMFGVQKEESGPFQCEECGSTDWINLSTEHAGGQSLLEWSRSRPPPPRSF